VLTPVPRLGALAVLMLGVLAAACGSASSPATSPPAAGCGYGTVNGVPARRFCGEAEARVEVAGRTLTFKGGQCERGRDYFALNIGTMFLEATDQERDYFAVLIGQDHADPTLGSKDGTYREGLVLVRRGADTYDLLEDGEKRITLRGERTEGEFAGTAPEVGPMRGTFRC
jgi:hypothetical protein